MLVLSLLARSYQLQYLMGLTAWPEDPLISRPAHHPAAFAPRTTAAAHWPSAHATAAAPGWFQKGQGGYRRLMLPLVSVVYLELDQGPGG